MKLDEYQDVKAAKEELALLRHLDDDNAIKLEALLEGKVEFDHDKRRQDVLDCVARLF